jgi:putative transposase
MPRLSRLVVPGYPHHITQRGVRSMDIFADDRDRLSYLQFMMEESERFGVTFLCWCLMSNHVHLIAVPEREESLARAIGEAHRRYTRMKNFTAEPGTLNIKCPF